MWMQNFVCFSKHTKKPGNGNFESDITDRYQYICSSTSQFIKRFLHIHLSNISYNNLVRQMLLLLLLRKKLKLREKKIA